jgi:hypothetical protein
MCPAGDTRAHLQAVSARLMQAGWLGKHGGCCVWALAFVRCVLFKHCRMQAGWMGSMVGAVWAHAAARVVWKVQAQLHAGSICLEGWGEAPGGVGKLVSLCSEAVYTCRTCLYEHMYVRGWGSLAVFVWMWWQGYAALCAVTCIPDMSSGASASAALWIATAESSGTVHDRFVKQ